MLVPAAGFIEIAYDQVKTLPHETRDGQKKELRSALGDVSDGFESGYELGLQVARVIITTSTAIQIAGVKAADVL